MGGGPRKREGCRGTGHLCAGGVFRQGVRSCLGPLGGGGSAAGSVDPENKVLCTVNPKTWEPAV